MPGKGWVTQVQRGKEGKMLLRSLNLGVGSQSLRKKCYTCYTYKASDYFLIFLPVYFCCFILYFPPMLFIPPFITL